MIVNDIVTGIIAIIIGYLLGSIPSAYIAARLTRGEDIRRLGGGNVGGLNTFREVGVFPAIFVAIVDVGKGAAAVAVALWLLEVSPLFVLLAGLASVVGHNWMVWLKFRGGKGMGATIGAISVLLPAYGYWQGLAIFFGVIIIPLIITHNVAFSMGIGLFSLPFVVWLGTGSGIGIVMALTLGITILIKFFPTAREAWGKSGTKKDFIFDRWQRHRR